MGKFTIPLECGNFVSKYVSKNNNYYFIVLLVCLNYLYLNEFISIQSIKLGFAKVRLYIKLHNVCYESYKLKLEWEAKNGKAPTNLISCLS